MAEQKQVMTPAEYFASRGFTMNRNRKWTALDTAKHEEAASQGKGFDCPRCAAQGTYRPYGADCNGGGHRRWLCKYCGYFFGSAATDPQAEGEFQCQPNHVSGAWSGPGAPGNMPTPLEACWPTWPWRH
jgi:hypothetical protein